MYKKFHRKERYLQRCYGASLQCFLHPFLLCSSSTIVFTQLTMKDQLSPHYCIISNPCTFFCRDLLPDLYRRWQFPAESASAPPKLNRWDGKKENFEESSVTYTMKKPTTLVGIGKSMDFFQGAPLHGGIGGSTTCRHRTTYKLPKKI